MTETQAVDLMRLMDKCHSLPALNETEKSYTAKCPGCDIEVAIDKSSPVVMLMIAWNRKVRGIADDR